MYIKYCILFTLQTQVHCHPMSAFSCKIWEVHGYHVSLNLSLQNRGKGKGLALPLLKRSKVKMSFLNFMTDIAFVDVTRLRKSQHLWWAFRVNIQRVCTQPTNASAKGVFESVKCTSADHPTCYANKT